MSDTAQALEPRGFPDKKIQRDRHRKAARAPKPRRLPSKKTQQGRHRKAELGPELYPTPPGATIALLKAANVPKRVWEPAAGLGHMTAVLAAAGHDVVASDLYDYGKAVRGAPQPTVGVDFLQCAKSDVIQSAHMQAVITNPPFSKADDFVRVGLEIAPEVFILARLAFLESQKRQDILDTRLHFVYPFINRLPMMHRWVPGPDGKYVEWQGKKSTSAISYAWFHFSRHHRPDEPVQLRRIRCERVRVR